MLAVRTVLLLLLPVMLSISPASLYAEIKMLKDIDYKAAVVEQDDKDLLDIYMPANVQDAAVIVYFHGGALRMGSKEDARPFALDLAAAGIGVVAASYRLTPTVMHPAHVQDAAAVMAWVVKNIQDYGGDPEKLYVSGHSAGAYLATLLALDARHLGSVGLGPAIIRGTIPISPFLYVEETAKVRPKDVWGNNPLDWLAASVTPHLETASASMLLIYADGDDDWRKNQNRRFAESMRASGNNVRVVEVSQRDHMSLISHINAKDDAITRLILDFMHKDR
jgi:acetyl esterase/lipase